MHFDPYAYAFHEDPYPFYERLRAEAPVYFNEELGFWAFARHADVLAGFRDWQDGDLAETKKRVAEHLAQLEAILPD